MTIYQKLESIQAKHNSLLCVGLDTDVNRIPSDFLSAEFPQFAFNLWLIDQTAPYVSAYKPNLAFYEAHGTKGLRSLELTMRYLRERHPEIVTIADAKRADIGNTSEAYATAIFDHLGFDAVTLNPYLGKEALTPFLARKDKACIILCKTSNPGSGELQDLEVSPGTPLWLQVAHNVAADWNAAQNCMLVVGATYPEQLATVRKTIGDMPILVPGIGSQGGDLPAVLKAGQDSNGQGLIISISRDIIFNEHPALQSEHYQEQMKVR